MVSFTSADLDAATSESGVVHENTANTDHTNASVLKQGYGVASPLFSADLVGYWPLQEDTGTTAYDFAGTNDGTITGAGPAATGTVAGPLGVSAYSFDSADDKIDTPYYYSNESIPISFVIWINTTNVDGVMAGARGTDTNDGAPSHVSFGLDSNGYPRLSVDDPGGGNMQELIGNIAVNDGLWHHLAIVFDNPNDSAEIYIDNTLNVTGTITNTGRQDGVPFDINNRANAAGSNQLGGVFSDIRVYEKALSSVEIQTLYDVVATSGTLTTAAKTV